MKEPFLYDIVDALYHGVMDNMPQAVQERNISSAFILGSLGIYGVVRGLQWGSKNVMNYFIPNFDEKYLPVMEKACIGGMIAIPLLYSMINPTEAIEIITQHPIYTSGMIGVAFGSIAGALQDLNKRSKQKSLEEKL